MEVDTLKYQTHVEYLILVSIGVLLTVIAASALIHVTNIVSNELGQLSSLKNSIIGVLT